MLVEVNPLLVRISAGGGSGMSGPTVSVDGNLVEFADIYGTRTRDSGLKADYVITQARLNYANVMDFGAVNTGAATPLSSRYASLGLAQVDFPSATSLTEEVDAVAIEKAIASCVANQITNLYFPVSKTIGGYYRVNKFIDAPFTSGAREGMINFIGNIGSANQKGYTSVIKRTVSAGGLRFKGTSLAVTGSNHLIKRVNIIDLVVDGGWADFNTNGDYPVFDGDSGYEFFWYNSTITQALGGVRLREVMDSRFNNMVVTWCGEKNGKNLALTMTSGSKNATCSSTVGIYAGQKIFGTGLNYMYVESITDATTLVLSKNANFTGTRTVVFEAKAAIHVCSNDTGSATSNNQAITGLRIESGPGCGLRIAGQNIVDIWLNQSKIEQVQYAMDYLLDIEGAVATKSRDLWLYGAPNLHNRMEYAITTSGKTLATALSAGLDTFTIPGAYLATTGDLTVGSAVVTNIPDTTGLFVGQQVSGTGSSNYLGVYIQSVDSATQVTLTEAIGTGNGGVGKALTFSISYSSGNFNVRQFFAGMPVLFWDTTDPRNYGFGRVVNYGTTTGVVDIHVLNVFGDTAKSITSWKLASCHAGLARVGEGSLMTDLDIIGGYPGGVDSANYPYMHTAVHVDGANGLDCTIRLNQGHTLLPKNSWQGYVSTTSLAVGTGTKTFTVPSGLPSDLVYPGADVFVSGNTVGSAQNGMAGKVVSYSVTTLETDIVETQGSGTLANWKITFSRQSAYLLTGTNSKLTLKEINPVYGVPIASANFIAELVNDYNANGLNGQLYAKQRKLIDATNIKWDLNTNQAAIVTLAGNRTLDNPTNMKAGASYTLIVVQDGTGSRTLAYGANYKWPSGSAPVLSTAANAIDILTFVSDGTNMLGSVLKAFA